MAQDLPCAAGLARFAASLGRVLLVQADEQVDQLAAHRPGAQYVRQPGQANEPLRVPGGPVITGSIDDPENTMMSLARLMQQGHAGRPAVRSNLAERSRADAAPDTLRAA
jgi:hypothetical protein